MHPKFLYFDLGGVLLKFSVDRMLRQMSDVAGVAPEKIREILYTGNLQMQYEAGEVSDQEFYEVFCERAGCRPDYEALRRAGSDIFWLNVSIVPIVAQLGQAGYRLGILSNTCGSHWGHCVTHYRMLREGFPVHALSHELKAAKPNPAIFEAAARLAGVGPADMFFVDDTAGHVAGAKAAGFDAVQYSSTPQLVADLRARRVEFNY